MATSNNNNNNNNDDDDDDDDDETTKSLHPQHLHRRSRRTLLIRLLIASILALALLLAIGTYRLIHNSRRRPEPTMPRKVMTNFPDPGLLEYNGTWYAFGTNPTADDDEPDFHVPIAMPVGDGGGNDGGFFGEWKHTGRDALPEVAMWETRRDHWAPDVLTRPDGRHLLYYSGELDVWRRHHCIGVAVSETTDPRGPYKAEGTYLACPSAHGGGIHPSAINDADGTIYVVYKGDGNSMNRYPSGSDSSDCTQAIPPLRSTPLLLQKMKADGIRADGEAVQILDRVEKEDGPLVEAPSLIRSAQGVYFLFYSSHCSDSRAYDVKYATARRITGPYVRAERPLLKTGDFGLVAPGGASVSKDGGKIAFHADCGDEGRCMWVAAVEIDGLEARVVASPS
ncbi:glycosyl hydrolase family 43 protein, variant [Blastomyces dermatitidis ER-3]|uniref:Glycosyl hydrolase family 43 protein n=1 Tax=Ajellomyces dermatitidis (strain ER-3 / ATCC MYA-2586) TaxID=559297 RepID=A0ABX2VV53_AJEDR|nr:glycosyl hydrolase family 43 protein [Blastomyces dermatitidis ER-3]XP_045280773.1 glycosyl hydrolase family 43 protein, variant [Blastomyces dermatitidis ER-3]OAT01045.1 glycosyl hydrolase family 43 protein [Blastomyces dermatitidis ER-3]OAT01046.1 glycosyl hydrolase family 43 protein, variant [Blastomyces dermatitidis ER-3]